MSSGLPQEGSSPPSELRELLRQHGAFSSAYFTLQPGVRHCVLPGVGYLAYHQDRWLGLDTAFVFTRPVCADTDLPRVLTHFFERHPGRVVFGGVDRPTADALLRWGFRRTEFGTEFVIPLESFSLRGRRTRYLRWAANLGRKGVVVREQRWDEVDQNAVRALSDAWLASKVVAGRELRLMTRPPHFGDEPGVRKLYAYRGDELVAFAHFDPYYRAGELVGYCANILRRKPGSHPSAVLDFTILQAIERFRSEGVPELSLGTAPCHGVQPCEHDLPALHRAYRLLYRHGGFLYSFAGLGFHKTRYPAQQRKVYACMRPRGRWWASLAILRSVGVIPGGTPPAAGTPEPDRYRRVASLYERLGQAYSGGAIRRSKLEQLRFVRPGQRILYAGGGAGEDAEQAARLGAQVTVVDLSAAMLDRLRHRLAGSGLQGSVRLVHQDILEHVPEVPYDAIAANYFLNVFPPAGVRQVLAHQRTLLAPAGKLLVADFRPRDTGPLRRLAQAAYHGAAVGVFAAVTRNALHDVYDYRDPLRRTGFRVAEVFDVPIGRRGPRWFRVWVAERQE